MLKEFDQHWAKAEKDNRDQFKFDGLDFYVPYAKYLSQYLHLKLGE